MNLSHRIIRTAVFSLLLGLWSSLLTANPAIQINLASTTAWTFQPQSSSTPPSSIPVPAGGWTLNGFPNASSGTYQRSITVPKLAGHPDARVFLTFEAVNWEAAIYAGKDTQSLQLISTHLSPWTPFRVDITDAIPTGNSGIVRVAVRDRSHFRDAQGKYTLPAGTEWTDRMGRGILRGVGLEIYPATYIEEVRVKPNTTNETLTLVATIVNRSKKTSKVGLATAFRPHNAKSKWNYPAIPTQNITLSPESSKVVSLGTVRWTPGRASWWFPNVPFKPNYTAQLHHAVLTLLPESVPAKPIQTSSVRFGFCSHGQKGNQYTLNGIPINLRGDSLTESLIGTDAFTRLAGFLPPTKDNAGWVGAIRNYQRLNFNVLRMHQSPATRYMMDICDELGMLVIPETAISGGKYRVLNLAENREPFETHLRELVQRDRNRPSVFKWSLANELFGAPESFVKRLYDICMETDGTRPCSIDDGSPELAEVDYPSYPNFTVIEHHSQKPGTPNAKGGTRRTDRPFGQGEFLYPYAPSPQGLIWMGYTTRSLRFHDNADIRPYSFFEVWHGVVPGLNPSNIPDPTTPPQSLEQGGKGLIASPKVCELAGIQHLSRSFAPVAAFDREYEMANAYSNKSGDLVTTLPRLEAGKQAIRSIEVFNDEFSGTSLNVRVEPMLFLEKSAVKRLPAIDTKVNVPLGTHRNIRVAFDLPQVDTNRTLSLMITVSKDGVERFREAVFCLVVPEINKPTVSFLNRDDKTKGNWHGVYGKRSFMVAVPNGASLYGQNGYRLSRGTGEPSNTASALNPVSYEPTLEDKLFGFGKMEPSNDERLPMPGPGITRRIPVAFCGEDAEHRIRAEIPKGKTARLTLYLVDFARRNQTMDVVFYDTDGNLLDSRSYTNLEEGACLTYEIRRSVVVKFSTLKRQPNEHATLFAAFLDD